MKALVPLSWAYGAGVALDRRARRVSRLPPAARPRVVSVGNLEVGGNGKTPLAMLLAARALEAKESVAYVSRGYGGSARADVVTCVLPMEVAPAVLTGVHVLSASHPDLAHAIGDEGALVVDRVPGVIALFCRDKRRAVRAAAKMGVERIILDDGFQSWGVARHRDIVLLDARRPLDGQCLLPAGRLREKPEALRRADAIVMNGAGSLNALATSRETLSRWMPASVALAGLTRRVTVIPAHGSSTQPPARALVVSGIARPDALVESLEAAGVRAVENVVFRDHHRYTREDVARMVERAREKQVPIVTTEKDWMKLRRLNVGADVWIARLDVTLIGDELPG